MFRIKICGITNVEDALAAASAGADAIGLNFYAKSPRCVALPTARQIADALPADIKRVGVFVNATADEVRSLAQELALDLIQLHGDESPELLGELKGMPVMRVFRPSGDFGAISDYLGRCDRLDCRPAMVLIDAYHPHQFGGTGETADWSAVKAGRSSMGNLPVALAGGLRAENVATAIAVAQPDAVDTASGVEVSLGRKVPELIEAFVANAQRAFDLLDRSR